jgi:hypothetical protein
MSAFGGDLNRSTQHLLILPDEEVRAWMHGEHECGCGAAGMPCPNCNPSDKDHPPRPPRGFQRDESLDDD